MSAVKVNEEGAQFRGTLEKLCGDAEIASQPWRPFETESFKLKKYIRSAAGSKRPSAHHVRTPKWLFQSALLLVETVLDHIEEKDVLLYFLDRSRAIRQEFTLQTEWVETDPEINRYHKHTLMLLSRFLVYEGWRYRDEDSMKHLDDALAACLSVLAEIQEFSQYQEVVYGTVSHPNTARRPPLSLVRYATDGMWTSCFREFDRASLLLQFAAARRLLPRLQLQSIAALNVALMGKFSIGFVTKLLRFSSEKACESVLNQLGLPIIAEDNQIVVMFKKNQPTKVEELVSEPLWKKSIVSFPVQASIEDVRRAVFENVSRI